MERPKRRAKIQDPVDDEEQIRQALRDLDKEERLQTKKEEYFITGTLDKQGTNWCFKSYDVKDSV